MSKSGLPLILFAPFPRSRALLFPDDQWQRLDARARIISHEGSPMPDALIDRHIGEAALVIGQADLPAERLARAGSLRAVINVEGNFLPNVDYAGCFERRIAVLGAGQAFAAPVAEMALALALDLARGVTCGDRAMREGRERYGLAGNSRSFLFTGADLGLIGFGNLGLALLPLLRPFGGRIRVHDPWLPEGHLRDHGVIPATLDEVLSLSRVTFVLAGVTDSNRGMIGVRELALVPDDAAFLLMSRAGVVDWPAFMAATQDGRFRAATDVFPEEPVPADDPVRAHPHLLLSSHRAGGLREAFRRMGEMVVDDVLLILDGLPSVRLQAARPETVGRMRSPPGRGMAAGGDHG